MSDTPDTVIRSISDNLRRIEGVGAPIIFADNVPFIGHVGGVIKATLSAGVSSVDAPGAEVPTAHLRLTRHAAEALIKGLQDIIVLADRNNSGAPIN
ncbi:hypothetical protein J2D73_20225 [Acetobacter sacchari]|uniref:Uncharacterized protein n=1 Tax=Acetobacter sacchari TaxID=2661687 RepID=A0ABS3M1U8_9PROT|nr:hypothetical protein [Acetobacter sacchari]MBO1362106.1 hypothetical protein [Acetobacter sacchari]